jgi:cellulose synthase operon protein YhjQ
VNAELDSRQRSAKSTALAATEKDFSNRRTMANRKPDDIDALYSHAGLDSSKYREFSSLRRGKEVSETGSVEEQPGTVVAEVSGSVETSEPPAVAGQTVDRPIEDDPYRGPAVRVQLDQRVGGGQGRSHRRRGTRPGLWASQLSPQNAGAMAEEPAAGGFRSQPQSAAVLPKASISFRQPDVAAREDRWALLNTVNQLTPSPAPSGSSELPQGSFALFSIGGGTGKTTVCATLARCLRGAGERLLVADFAEDSLFPLYFGSNHIRSGSLETFLSEGRENMEPLHLFRGVDAATDWADGDGMLERLRSQVTALGDNFDRVMLDLPAGAHKLRWPLLQAARTCLVIVVPDLHSVIGVANLEQLRHKPGPNGKGDIAFYYVLNKFNPARPLHLEIRQRLHQQLGERLLPIYIQRSDDIPEALAAGGTVLDYAPQAPVSEDFLRLADWIRTIA